MEVAEKVTVVLLIVPGLLAVGVLQSDPDESSNINFFSAFEWTQVTPHSVWSKDVAPRNMLLMSMARDTSHLDRSWLNEVALSNMLAMLVTCDTSHLDKSWLKDGACANIMVMVVT